MPSSDSEPWAHEPPAGSSESNEPGDASSRAAGVLLSFTWNALSSSTMAPETLRMFCSQNKHKKKLGANV